MICNDFRARWADQDPVGAESGFVDLDLDRHRSSCSVCATWVDRSDALDGLLGAALVVEPPPDLAARLALLPTTFAIAKSVPATVEDQVWGIALEFAALLLIGIGMFVLVGNNLVVSWETGLVRVADILQAASLIASGPVLPYVQNLAVTGLEALATILLLLMGFDRMVSRSGLETASRRQQGR